MNEAELITFFKDIHAHPELGFAEKRTTAKVLKALRAHGMDVPLDALTVSDCADAVAAALKP